MRTNYYWTLIFRSKGHNPYPIPIGGSNVLGLWGYIEAFREFIEQVE